jgi:dTDP-4-dehydrorhamnose reductase
MTREKRLKVLVLGASGMLGNAVCRYFVREKRHAVVGSVRSDAAKQRLPSELHSSIFPGVDATRIDVVARLFAAIKPQAVINCIGIVKQLPGADDPLEAIPVNALLPHRLAQLCAVAGAHLIHVSTDCVFSGAKGNYRESDAPDARDLYGRSKLLGEIEYPHTVTLRTSIIGPERESAHGLVAWFLTQKRPVSGYTKAIFSGLPTVELARVIHDFVLPHPDLRGLYHVSSSPIDKCALLRLIAREYQKTIQISPDDQIVIDRSLDSERFRRATGYASPAWPDLVRAMHEFG